MALVRLVALKNRSAELIAANQKDLRLAEKNKIASPLLKRLKIDEGKIARCHSAEGVFGKLNQTR